jgi:hypothetical protein
MKEEQGLLIQWEKIWMQQGLSLWLQGEIPAPKPLNHEDLLIIWGHHSSIWHNNKNMPLIMASISRKSSNKVPIIFFQMLLAGRQTHNNRAFFMGSRGFSWVWLWEVKILWVRIMGVILVQLRSLIARTLNLGFP